MIPLSRTKEIFMELIFILSIISIGIGLFFYRVFLFAGVSVILLLFLFDFFNSIIGFKGKVVVETPDGFNQPYHPSIVHFDSKWNYYKYWMAYTPFPIGAKPYIDRWEYPCIVVSNDGIHWKYADRVQPLDDLTQEQINNRDYFSDTHLIYNKDKDRLECFYRLNEHFGETSNEHIFLFRRVSYNGVDWSEREIIADSRMSDTNNLGSPIISPAVEIIENKYNLWYVIFESEKAENMKIYYSRSDDALHWDARKQCSLNGYTIDPWHLDCKYYDGKYWLLIYDFTHKLTLWSSVNGIDFDFKKIVLKPSRIPVSFYSKSLYRSCMVKDDDLFFVYFSAGDGKKHSLGLMKGDRLTNLKVVSATGEYSFKEFILYMFEKYTRISRWMIKNLKKHRK